MGRRHYVACLFTSVGYGKPTKNHPGMDRPETILENTRKALADLREQVKELNCNHTIGSSSPSPSPVPSELWSCKFNSGLFAVRWEDSRKLLEEEMGNLIIENGLVVKIVSPRQ